MTFYPAAPVPFVPAGDPTAVVGKRIGAAIIDAIITAAIVALVFAVNHDSIERTTAFGNLTCDSGANNFCFTTGDTIYYAEGGKAATMWAVGLLVGFANHALLQGTSGASIGKKAVGLRVIKKDTGQLASVGPNALRWLVSLFDIGCCFLIALIMIITTKGHRRLGDMAANTLVVDANSVGSPPVVPGLTSPEFGGPYATSYPQAGSPFAPPQAASPTGWPPPAAPTPPPPSAPVADTAPAANTPTWDAQRNTYVIFDSAQNQWMMWDATSQQWRPIS
ncbi:MAG: RDD family protein [Acidimicrobiales bacterium]